MTENTDLSSRGFGRCVLRHLAGDAASYSITWYGWARRAGSQASARLLVKSRRTLALQTAAYHDRFLVLWISIFWSDYPPGRASALRDARDRDYLRSLAIGFTLRNFSGRSARALRAILALSSCFRARHLCFCSPADSCVVDRLHGRFPARRWSRDLLFTGGRIQGIVRATRTARDFSDCSAYRLRIQLASDRIRPRWGIFCW